MNALVWVALGLLLYWVVLTGLRSRGALPEYVGVAGPLLTVHTKRGKQFIDRVAGAKRFWRAWGNFGLGVALVVMVGSVAFLVSIAALTVQNPPEPTAVNQPRSVLAIPVVNPYLPASVAPEIVAGLVLGLVVHEGGHGVLCRVEDIEIESLGLVFLTLIPAGAFVEPDEESQRRASRGGRSRMFAAGVTNNFALTAVAFLLLFGPVVGSIGVVSGATIMGTLPGSPAARAGVGQGDVVVSVAGRPVGSNGELTGVLRNTTDRTVPVTFRSGETATIARSVLVTGAPRDDWPTGVPRNATLVAVNGTAVNTTAGFLDAVAGRPVAAVTSADGTTYTGPMGALVVPTESGPIADAGAPAGDPLVVTRFGGERVASADDLSDLLDRTRPGEEATVVAYTREGRTTYEVTLGDHPRQDTGYLGVFISPGVSGLTLTDFGVETFPAGNYLAVLGGECPSCRDLSLSPGQRVVLALELPIVGVAGGAGGALPYNFVGFAGAVTNFYVPRGPLAFLGGGLFLLANLLFWTAWINLNLGFFNCIPTFMLDGGHMFRAAAEAVVSRLPVANRARLVAAATVSVQLLMLGSLLLVLFGAQLLG